MDDNRTKKDSRQHSGQGPKALRPRLPFRSKPTSGSPQAGIEPQTGTRRLVILSCVLLTIILSALMTVPLLPGQDRVEAGMPAQGDIYAPAYLHYESEVLTQKARDEASQDPSNEVWTQDSQLVEHQRSLLLSNLLAVSAMRQQSPDPLPRRQRDATLQGITLTQTMLDTLTSMTDADYSYWRNSAVIPAFDTIMKSRQLAKSVDVQTAQTRLPDILVPDISPQAKAAAVAVISPLIVANMRLNATETKSRQDAAAANVKPIVVTVQKGEAILRQGELVTPEAVEKMQQAGLLSRKISLAAIGGTSSLVALLMVLLHLYLYRRAPHVWKRRKQLLLVALLIIFTVGVARGILPGHTLLPYMLPLAGVSMLIAVLLGTDLAVMVTFVLSLLVGVMTSNGLSIELPTYYFVGGLAGIFSLTRVEKVSTFARAGFFIAVASFVAVISLRVLSGTSIDWTAIGVLALAGMVNAGISTSITYAAFSLLGTLFGITTPLQLMELAHPDQPLLRRLMQEAPGTYHHSLVVSNLAERAAEMIGADALLTRVCAYYHDIGKVERPNYFIDNQTGMRNIHEELDPYTSTKVIAGHVSDGVKLGEKYKLPRKVLDAIPQHHGTMLIQYFYYKAKEADPDVNPEDFRYPGPRPQTKENAILMLADGVEATVRSMAQSGALDKLASNQTEHVEGQARYNDQASLPEDAIAQVVHKVINERIEDGQLDECDLTVRDTARIGEAFVSMLKGIYHPRITYPDGKSTPALAPQTTPAIVSVAAGNSILVPSTTPLELAKE
ncbi:MAG: HDIG domain-containing protein [Chloroflexota bacterium]|nr:HDIG domain-containing protein [Chloroflexota bacterium]